MRSSKRFGSSQTNITNYNTASDSSPAWSPYGVKIVFSSDRDSNLEIYVMNADGSGQINLTNNGNMTLKRPQFPYIMSYTIFATMVY